MSEEKRNIKQCNKNWKTKVNFMTSEQTGVSPEVKLEHKSFASVLVKLYHSDSVQAELNSVWASWNKVVFVIL